MSLPAVFLLVCAAAVVLGLEWPRIASRVGIDERRSRRRAKRKSKLTLIRSDAADDDADAFAAAVERDLANLPTIDRDGAP